MPSPDTAPSSHCIDWLTYTVPTDVGVEAALMPHKALYITGEVLPNIQGYDRTLALSHGRISYHTRYPQYKICVTFKGSELGQLRGEGVSLEQMLAYALDHKGSITRLDFALDYFGPSSPEDLYNAWDQKRLRTPAHEVTKMENHKRNKEAHDVAHTIYFGSWESLRFLCCYDKAMQKDVPGP